VIASGSWIGFADGTAQEVDAMSKKELFSYGNIPAEINVLARSPDGTRMATACSNGVSQVWRVP
jgi:hypothetical protein